MDFNEVMTKEINQKIQSQVNRDYAILLDAFAKFIRKYRCRGTVGDFERIKEYTLKSLKEDSDAFIMFPELRNYLFEKEASKVVAEVLYSQDDLSR